MTNSAGLPRKSASDTVLPSTLGNENLGACVPNGNIVLGVRTIGGLRGNALIELVLRDDASG
jgi:hypothetical protein